MPEEADTLPHDLRAAVYRLLGIEVAINSQVLQASPEQIASTTVYNGSLDCLPALYPDLCDTPSVFCRAAVSYPSDPEGFLQGVQNSVSRLKQDAALC